MNSKTLRFTRKFISILMNAIIVETFSEFVGKMLNFKWTIRIENRLTNAIQWYLNDISQHAPAFIQLIHFKCSLFTQKCYQIKLASGNCFFLSRIREKLYLIRIFASLDQFKYIYFHCGCTELRSIYFVGKLCIIFAK